MDLEFKPVKRPLFLINGKAVRNLKVEIKTHPKIDLKDFIFGPPNPDLHWITLMRFNGEIAPAPKRFGFYQRKSGRMVHSYDYI